MPQTEDQCWERGPIFAGLNTNKKSLTLDLSRPTRRRPGAPVRRDLRRRRRELHAPGARPARPRLRVAARESGPTSSWCGCRASGSTARGATKPAFAFVIEDASGLTWLTGHPDQLPLEPYCVGDPNAGLHALFGLLLALEHRDRTGEGCLVEAAMVDAALNVAAEQVIEHSAYGALLERAGNRGPPRRRRTSTRPPGLNEYGPRRQLGGDRGRDRRAVGRRCARALGDPEWATDPALATVHGRACEPTTGSTRTSRSGAALARPTRSSNACGMRACRWPRSCSRTSSPTWRSSQFRGFFEEVDHPVIGPLALQHAADAVLARSASAAQRGTRRCSASTTSELLAELGLDPSEIDALEADGIIGRSLLRDPQPQ